MRANDEKLLPKKGYFCTTAFNESHAIVLGWISNRVYQAKLVNIKTNHWTYWPSLPLKDGDSGLLHGCQTTVGYSSKDKRFLKYPIKEFKESINSVT